MMCRQQGRETGDKKQKIRRGEMNPGKDQIDLPNKGIKEKWDSKR